MREDKKLSQQRYCRGILSDMEKNIHDQNLNESNSNALCEAKNKYTRSPLWFLPLSGLVLGTPFLALAFSIKSARRNKKAAPLFHYGNEGSTEKKLNLASSIGRLLSAINNRDPVAIKIVSVAGKILEKTPITLKALG